MLSTSCNTAETASCSTCVCCLLNTVLAGPAPQLHQLVRRVHHTTQGVPCYRVGDRGRAFGQVCTCIASLSSLRVDFAGYMHVPESIPMSACCPAVMLHHVANSFGHSTQTFLHAVARRHTLVFSCPLAGTILHVRLMQHCTVGSLQPVEVLLSDCRIRCQQHMNSFSI